MQMESIQLKCLSAERPGKEVLSSGKRQSRSEPAKPGTLKALAVPQLAGAESPQLTGRNVALQCWEKLSLSTWANTHDHQHSSREDGSSSLKSLSAIYARFWVMSYEENVRKSETKGPSRTVWHLFSYPPLSHTLTFLDAA